MAHNHQTQLKAVDLNALFSTLADEVQLAVKQGIKNLNTPAKKELLSSAEAAQEYGMTESYWRKQIFHRTIPIIKMGKSVRLQRKDIEAFIEENKIEA